MNQYQRYKLRNDKIVADLKEKIRILIEEPESPEAFRIKAEYNFLKQKERMLMAGSITSTDKGLIDHVMKGGSEITYEPHKSIYDGSMHNSIYLDESVLMPRVYSPFYRTPSEVIVKRSLWDKLKFWKA